MLDLSRRKFPWASVGARGRRFWTLDGRLRRPAGQLCGPFIEVDKVLHIETEDVFQNLYRNQCRLDFFVGLVVVVAGLRVGL